MFVNVPSIRSRLIGLHDEDDPVAGNVDVLPVLPPHTIFRQERDTAGHGGLIGFFHLHTIVRMDQPPPPLRIHSAEFLGSEARDSLDGPLPGNDPGAQIEIIDQLSGGFRRDAVPFFAPEQVVFRDLRIRDIPPDHLILANDSPGINDGPRHPTHPSFGSIRSDETSCSLDAPPPCPFHRAVTISSVLVTANASGNLRPINRSEEVRSVLPTAPFTNESVPSGNTRTISSVC